MTKKDFELIAGLLKRQREAIGIAYAVARQPATRAIGQHDTLAQAFADELASTNPRFNRERFLRACGCDA